MTPPGEIPPAFTRHRPAGANRPGAGLADLTVPWTVLAGLTTGPGMLGRLGPITASQAIRLADAAAADPATEWRIIVTTLDGQATAVSRIRRRPPARDGPPAGPGLVGRVTLTITDADLTSQPGRAGPQIPDPGGGIRAGPPGRDSPPGHDQTAGILRAAMRAARRAAARATEQAHADAAAGGCAHAGDSERYRPPPRLQEFVVARDLTCRFPGCRQPAWRGDLDHTVPWPGGPTCRCNLGGLCRTHHLLKQHPDWSLRQTAPGVFEWATPSGRTYRATPDSHIN